jgi:putative Ca2+/H+ antiporter (TMEM165/GDT1 family)
MGFSFRPELFYCMEAFLVSTGIVALAEMGDKTQLLAIVLATRFRAPVAVIAGILIATLANHALAAWAGSALAGWFDGVWFRYAVAASFIAMAGWTLIPDKLDGIDDTPPRYGAFLTTTIAFFIVEIGDKTQIATVALAAKYHDIVWVAAGTTTGMMLANVPAVYLGEAATKVAPMAVVRMAAAGLFAAIGVWTLLQTSGLLG